MTTAVATTPAQQALTVLMGHIFPPIGTGRRCAGVKRAHLRPRPDPDGRTVSTKRAISTGAKGHDAAPLAEAN
ncbi:hypothetical protein KB1_05970 [Cutibacterium modestum]|uniref:Uncharacterized protein n=1 Tax=Cutibacterium modestum TaxID=2559073 RepID=A0AAD1NUD5_9ACTN|nr:hypothetical protein KB1_05970 [Cutibacterium modestum]